MRNRRRVRTMLTDQWKSQKARVQALAQRSRRLERWSKTNREMFKSWARSLGEPEVIAWAFAGGLLWAAGRGSSKRRLKSSRSVMRLANSVLLAWQFVNRVKQVRLPE